MLTIAILGLLTGVKAGHQTSASGNVERRVEEILGKLTVEEKIDLLGGHDNFYTEAIPRLGIPSMRMSDGPAGVHNYGPTTAYAAPVTIAASWDPELARRVGRSFGLDARQRGVNIVLAPGVNIDRVPFNGRNFEYLGEDPYLASQLVVPWIQGIQNEGVIATVKHFAANSQERGRMDYSMNVDERTLREIYFPAFEASVKQGKVWSVMCAYNLLNGTYASANEWLLTDVLKKEWGFQGFVMSDWGAVHDSIPVANSGMDLEMPWPTFLNRKNLLPALQDGRVKQATIDDKIRRMLRSFISMGFFDRPQTRTDLNQYNPEGAGATYQESKEGMVLLKNAHSVLPLDRARIKRIAVIGPNASPAVWGGGGSAYTNPVRAISLLDAIVTKAGEKIEVSYSPGVAGAPSEVFNGSRFTTASGARGLDAEYFDNKNLEGMPKVKRVDARIDNKWDNGPAPGIGHDNFSVRWSGNIKTANAGTYEFYAQADDGFRVFVDGKKVLDEWRDQGQTDYVATLKLEANKTYPIVVEYYQGNGDAVMRMGWRAESNPAMVQAVQTAKNADAVILAMGYNSNLESEGSDRTFGLPSGQDELIRQVSAVNKNTIVVLNAGGSADATPWIDGVAGFVHAWYPGQDGNRALADILFGDVNPSGKLPMSFDRKWEESAAYGNYPGDVTKSVDYKEGLFVGYRHYDKIGKAPLYPFGYGLSYTTFGYSDLKLDHPRTPDPNVRVSFTLRNTGTRAGAEVAQVYVQPMNAPVPRPIKELKGFARVDLQPGQGKTVTLNLDPRAFSYWDIKAHKWVVAPGEYRILVGSSSQTLPLDASVKL